MRRYDFRSEEEFWFYLWLLEAQKFGFISGFEYEKKTFTISEQWQFDKTIYMKTKKKHEITKLFENADDLTYTPDFVFVLTEKGRIMWRDNIFARSIQNQSEPNMVYVDVKGGYNPYGGDHRAFFLKQRMMWTEHLIYVHKINPKPFFKKCFAPDCMRWMRARKEPTLTKVGRHCPTSKVYFEKNKWRMQGELI